MVKKKRKMPILLLLSLILISLVVGSTIVYAAMTTREEKKNQFQISYVQATIDESFKEPVTVMPGKKIEKNVKILNSGTADQFVRVMLFPEIKKEMDGGTRILSSTIGTDILLDINEKDWILGEDGYYYYLNINKPGNDNETSSLFTTVTLSDSLVSSYKDASFTLLVKAEVINCTSDSYKKAWWQGVTPTEPNLKKIDNELSKKTEN